MKATRDSIEALKELADGANSLDADVGSAYAEQEVKFLDGYLGYTTKVTQTIGVLGGFGFTAVAEVKFLPLFMAGELMIMGAIVFGLLKTRSIYTSTLQTLKSAKIRKVTRKRNLYISGIYRAAIATGHIPDDFQQKLSQINEELVENDNLEDESDDKLQDHLIWMISIACLGVVMVVLSFAEIDHLL